ncbi:hypothetical protein O1611_g9190 [Lasiodiplodia mahajangana]|uniref:Uncharacterized protein n=1 Tax=Lasiodiplodia mahajangana TaxID=1108764 RepID=A0ACC2JAP3_9PEZI|nr:hypothetical protein O1611_g9190 [Lasiodiplodia mahajangana]
MSSKRKFSEFNAESSAAGNTREHTSGYHNSKFNKRKKGPSQEKPTSISWLKKRARTIERRLNHNDSLPANVKHDLEKELDHHRQKLEDLADSRKRQAMIKKYHMVRFFERKKADRLAKKIRTQLGATKDEEEEKRLQADLHIAEVDALYAKYFPHRERYVSLYPVSSSPDSGAQGETKTEDSSGAARFLHTERPPLWGTIEKAAEKGTSALVQIQERKSPVNPRSVPSQEQSSRHSPAAKADQPKAKNSFASESAEAPKSKGKHQPLPDASSTGSDDDSDGGFFEEG